MALVRRESLRVRNPDIAQVFEDIASFLEIKGEVFTVRAYRRAAQVIRGLPVELDRMVADGADLREIPGIGDAISKKIAELVATGRLGYYERLRGEFPDGVVQMLRVPGLGPRLISRVWKDLGVTTVDELEAAIEDGRIEALPRISKKGAVSILENVRAMRSGAERNA